MTMYLYDGEHLMNWRFVYISCYVRWPLTEVGPWHVILPAYTVYFFIIRHLDCSIDRPVQTPPSPVNKCSWWNNTVCLPLLISAFHWRSLSTTRIRTPGRFWLAETLDALFLTRKIELTVPFLPHVDRCRPIRGELCTWSRAAFSRLVLLRWKGTGRSV